MILSNPFMCHYIESNMVKISYRSDKYPRNTIPIKYIASCVPILCNNSHWQLVRSAISRYCVKHQRNSHPLFHPIIGQYISLYQLSCNVLPLGVPSEWGIFLPNRMLWVGCEYILCNSSFPEARLHGKNATWQWITWDPVTHYWLLEYIQQDIEMFPSHFVMFWF